MGLFDTVRKLRDTIRRLRRERRELREQLKRERAEKAQLEAHIQALESQLPPIATPPRPTEPADAGAAPTPEAPTGEPPVPEPPARAPAREDVAPLPRLRGIKGVSYATYFRAWGGTRVQGFAEDDPAGMYQFSDPEALPPPPGYDTGPAAFYSQSSLGGLGQVRFEGEIPLAVLIDRLNASLGVIDERGDVADFRTVYSQWSYTYRVVEFINGKNPKDVQCLTAGHNQRLRSCLK